MNEEALKDSYNLFVETGYKGSIEDYTKLIRSNPEALKDSHKLFVDTGYNGDESQFSELIGLKKKEDSQDSYQESTQNTQENSERPVEPSETQTSADKEEPLLSLHPEGFENLKQQGAPEEGVESEEALGVIPMTEAELRIKMLRDKQAETEETALFDLNKQKNMSNIEAEIVSKIQKEKIQTQRKREEAEGDIAKTTEFWKGRIDVAAGGEPIDMALERAMKSGKIKNSDQAKQFIDSIESKNKKKREDLIKWREESKYADFLASDSDKQEVELIKEIEKAQKWVDHYSKLGDKESLQVAENRLKEASDVLSKQKKEREDKIEYEISELSIDLKNTSSEEEREEIQRKIDILSSHKENVFKPIETVTEEITDGEGVENVPGKTPQEKFNNYYDSLYQEFEDLRKLEKIKQLTGEEGMLSMLGRKTAAYFSDDEEIKRLYTLQQKLENFAPVRMLNKYEAEPEEGGFIGFGKSFLTSLGNYTTPINRQTDLEKSQDLYSTLKQTGVDIDKGIEVAAKKNEDGFESYGLSDPEFYGSLIGTSTALMSQMVGGGAAIKGTKLVKYLDKSEDLAKILSRRRYIEELSKSPRLAKLFNNISTKAIKFGKSAVSSGTKYEATGIIFERSEDESNFMSGLYGSAGEQALTSLFPQVRRITPILRKMLGDNGMQRFITSVTKRGAKLTGRGAGETAEEFMQEVSSIQRESNGDFYGELEKRFGDFDDATKFVVSSFIMGAFMGGGAELGSDLYKSSVNALEKLKEQNPKQALIAIDALKYINEGGVEALNESVNESKINGEYKVGDKDMPFSDVEELIDVAEDIKDLEGIKVENDKELEQKLANKYNELSKKTSASEKVKEGEITIKEENKGEALVEEQAVPVEVAEIEREAVEKLPESTFKSEEQLTSELNKGRWGMLSGENTGAKQMSPEENLKRNEEAKSWLEEKGYAPQPIVGKYKNVENSFYVPELSKEDAIEFAKKFDQESVATSEGLVYQDGSIAPIVKGSAKTGVPEGNDNYSTIKINGEAKPFTVEYKDKPAAPENIQEEISVKNKELNDILSKDNISNSDLVRVAELESEIEASSNKVIEEVKAENPELIKKIDDLKAEKAGLYGDPSSEPQLSGIELQRAGQREVEINKELSSLLKEKHKAISEKRQKDTTVNKKKIPEGKKLFNDPDPETAKVVEGYKKEKGIKTGPGEKITSVDKDRAMKLADAYENMKDNPGDPEVQKAYNKMADETMEQYEHMKKAGYQVEIYEGKGEPYASSGEMIRDLVENKHIFIFGTEGGFGETGITDKARAENKMLQSSGEVDVNGKELLINDVFRAIHDFFGHSERGNGFGAIGEENAWDVHARMFSPLARRAMTTETRGQNSWVNFGPQMRNSDGSLKKKGDKGYLSPRDRSFAEQKMGLLPEEFSKLDEEISTPKSKEESREKRKADRKAPKSKEESRKRRLAERKNKKKGGEGSSTIQKQNISDVDGLISKSTNSEQKKALGTVKNIIKALTRISPETSIVLHNDQNSYKKAILEAGGTASDASSRGMVDTGNQIHINLGKVNSNTVLHEASHVVMGAYLKKNPNAITSFKKQLEGVLSSKEIESLNKFSETYEGQDAKNDEFVTEALSRIANGEIVLTKESTNKIIEFLRKIARAVGLDPKKVKLTGKEDVVDFANKLTKAFNEGKEISIKEGDVFSGELNVTSKPDKIKLSKVMDALEVEKIPTHSNTKVIENFNLSKLNGQKVSSTLSDKLMTGVIGGHKLLGGIFYPKATGRVWAAGKKAQANKIVNDIKVSKDGYRYLIPAIMSDVSHMSNKNMAKIAMSLLNEASVNGEVNNSALYKDIIGAFSKKSTREHLKPVKKLLGSKPSRGKMLEVLENYLLSDKMLFETRKEVVSRIVGESGVGKPKYPTVGTFSDLARSLSEDKTKDLGLHQVVTVIRTKGNLKAVETKKGDEFYHESYPFHVESDSEVELLVLDGAYDLTEIIPEFTTSTGTKYSTKEAIEGRKESYTKEQAIKNLGRTHGLSSYSSELKAPSKPKDLNITLKDKSSKAVKLQKTDNTSEAKDYINDLKEDGFLEEITPKEIQEDLRELGIDMDLDKIAELKNNSLSPKGVFDNKALETGKKKKVKQIIDENLKEADKEYNELSNELAIKEAKRIVKENPIDVVEKSVLDLSNNMDEVLRTVLLLELIKYNEKNGNDSRASELWKVYKTRGTKTGQTLQSLSIAAKDPEIKTRSIIRNAREGNSEFNDAKGDNGSTNKKNIEDSFSELKDIAIKIGIDVSNSETVEGLVDKIVTKKLGSKSSEKVKKAQANIKKAKAKRNKLTEEFKNGKDDMFYSSIIPGLTPKAIEYFGNIAKTYIEEGVANTDILIQKLKDFAKTEFGAQIRDEDIAKIKDKFFSIEVEETVDAYKKEIKNVIKDHYSSKEALQKELSQKLIDRLGLTEKEAKAIEKVVRKEFKSKVQQAAAQNLDSVYKKTNLPRNHPAIKDDYKDDVDRMIEAFNQGAFSDSDYRDLVSSKFGYRNLTDSDIEMLERYLDVIQTLDPGEFRNRKIQALNNELSKLEEVSKSELIGKTILEIFYTSVLSGFSTVSRALKGAALTSTFSSIATAIAHPIAAPRAFSAMLGGFSRFGIDGWRQVMKDGFSDVDFFDIKPSAQGVLDQLVNKSFSQHALSVKEAKGGKDKALESVKILAKTFFQLPVYSYRFLIANDAVMKAGLREFNAHIEAYNEELLANNGKREQGFWSNLNKKMSLDKTSVLQAEVQAAQEIEKLKAEGESIPLGYKKRRTQEIINLKRDAKYEGNTERALQQANEALLMTDPVGMLGSLYRGIQKTTKIQQGDSKLKILGKSGLRMLGFPFIRVATNYMNTAIDYSPIASIPRLIKRSIYGVSTRDGQRALTPRETKEALAKMSIGVGVTAMLYLTMFDSDDEENLILDPDSWIEVTAGGPGKYYIEGKSVSSDYKTYSFRIKNPITGEMSNWYSYLDNPLGAMIAPMGTMSDTIRFKNFKEEAKEGETKDVSKTDLVSPLNLAKFLTSQSYSQGMKTLQEIAGYGLASMTGDLTEGQSEYMDQKIVDLLSRPVKGMIMPNLYKQFYQQYNAYQDKPMKHARGYDKIIKDIPLLENIIEGDDYDMFGYPITRDFEIPLIPDLLLDAAKDVRRYREDRPEWKVIYEFPEVNLGGYVKSPKGLKDSNVSKSEYLKVYGQFFRKNFNNGLRNLKQNRKYNAIEIQRMVNDIKGKTTKEAKRRLKLK